MPSVLLLDADGARARADELWAVYDAVFADVDDRSVWDERLASHTARDGFRATVAEQEGSLVGFAYGYTGERGQPWADRVASVLGSSLGEQAAGDWVGGHFEVVELAVLDGSRGLGLGRRLHDDLLDALPHRRALLSTEIGDSPAVRLYTARGWQRLGLLDPSTQVLGLRLG